MNREMNKGREVAISKALSYLLRHDKTMRMDAQGWAKLDDVLKKGSMLKLQATQQEIRQVVENSDKQRYALKQDGAVWKVKANQGHSLAVNVELTPITSADQIPVAIHGTYFDAWKIIKKDGLSRMGRNHIHFAIGQYGSAAVISGMRGNSQVLIYLDTEALLKDGLPLLISQNQVVLSPGNADGKIPVKYFKYVLNTKLEPFDPDFPNKP
eukprot:TRINITY_DN2194_c0_g1_i2.p1 TRINITY_DN2194_c0_g1~~TRINITY_DN2194_c0_g1_i2.p1  ORF type:complete len:211 (+),score=30.60 TRINITY_DN2194_c0_g1_i2:115-747(+)